MQIPAELRAALDAQLEGVPRGPLTERAERISTLYRDSAASAIAVRDETDALAYAITRAPATYGAVRNALMRLQERNPNFTPATALDLGTGTGAASWAIAEMWPQITAITQVDNNQPLLRLNRTLAQQSSNTVLRSATQITANLTQKTEAAQADLVTLSYILAELPDTQAQSLLNAAWSLCTGAFVLVEPGTPAGYKRILTARTTLLNSGAHILTPCPHEQSCPLIPPDWCHFAQRIERSRDHRLLKSADLPYEDEKFSYLIAVREPHFTPASAARILARPERAKTSITTKLCQPNGAADLLTILKRDKPAWNQVKKKEWGNEF
jgi:ribosomal protein RSM22 (predicted rRNA methylase)